MLGIIGIITLLLVLGLSLLITRLASTALTLTGLSRQVARFQARSAFTGTGFTTDEAKQVVDHPVRRRIIMGLMVLRSAGLVTIIISLILSFAGNAEPRTLLVRLGWLLAGLLVLWVLAVNKAVDRWLSRVMEWALNRWTDLDTRDYGSLLKLTGPYEVQELRVQEGDWLTGKTLDECNLSEEGVLVLGIHRQDGDYVGAPQPSTEIYAGDTLILYGREKSLHNLSERRDTPKGDREHHEAVSDQAEEIRKQDVQEAEHKRRRKQQEQE